MDFVDVLNGNMPDHSNMSMPKLFKEGTICVVNLEEEIMLARLLEDVHQGQQDVLALMYQIASNSLVAKSLASKSIKCSVLGKTIDINESNFTDNDIIVTEAQYEEIFEERYLQDIDDDADDAEINSIPLESLISGVDRGVRRTIKRPARFNDF